VNQQINSDVIDPRIDTRTPTVDDLKVGVDVEGNHPAVIDEGDEDPAYDDDEKDEEEIEDEGERPFLPFSEETNSISAPGADENDDEDDLLIRNI
jgi:hypothetical protein